MLKALFIFVFGLLVFGRAEAQKKDTIVNFVKFNGELTMSRDSAQYIRFILPPDSTVDKDLFPVHEFYTNGKRKLIAAARSRSGNLKFEGSAISYFTDGKRKSFMTFSKGDKVGDITNYYPNGKIYTTTRYSKDNQLLLITCKDSAGKVLAEDGNGKWLEFNDDFTWIVKEGTVKHGVAQKDWHYNYSSDTTTTYAANNNFIRVDIPPTYKGGVEALFQNINHNLKYPVIDFENKITGQVMVSFIVEKDGSLSNFTIVKSPSATMNEEAIRVIKLTAPWIPGYARGKPVRAYLTMPINFSIAN